MNAAINQQQTLDWAIKLTAQADYHALTYCFLEMLEQLPEIDHVIAYEIYGGSNRKTGEARSICEQLIRRFPLDLSESTQDENSELLNEINATDRINPSMLNDKGLFCRVVASIRDVAGPDRALLFKGQFDAELIELISSLTALYRNQVALHDSKERDPLTRLPNRQSFNRRLEQVCEHYRHHPTQDVQYNKSSWIAIMDLDHFKRINDTYGHLYGDEVLLTLSQLMEKHFRFNDFLFRFGGEEFVVILNLVNQHDAETTFDRFRQIVAQHRFGAVGQVTISIGMTHIDSSSMPTTLLDRSDKALYYSKDNGRNQLNVYEKIADATVAIQCNETDFF